MIKQLKALKKRFFVNLIVLVILTITAHVFLYGFMGAYFFAYYNLAALIMGIFVWLYVKNKPFDSIEHFLHLYLIFTSWFLFLYSLVLWEKTPIVFLWYFLIPYGLNTLYNYKIVVKWCVYILFLIVMTVAITPHIYKYLAFLKPSHINILVVNISSIVNILLLICFISYYAHKISGLKFILKANISSSDNDMPNETSLEKDENNPVSEDGRKYDLLYQEILYYFENNKSYLEKDFNVAWLALQLNSNVSYVSRAIKINAQCNFNYFLNRYRVESAKKMIIEQNLDRYSLMYIYSSSGFKNQSTFNRVFKEIEGLTPSAFIKNYNKEISSQ